MKQISFSVWFNCLTFVQNSLRIQMKNKKIGSSAHNHSIELSQNYSKKTARIFLGPQFGPQTAIDTVMATSVPVTGRLIVYRSHFNQLLCGLSIISNPMNKDIVKMLPYEYRFCTIKYVSGTPKVYHAYFLIQVWHQWAKGTRWVQLQCTFSFNGLDT